MTIRFHPINTAAKSYPKPRFPVQPILDLSLIKLRVKKSTESAFFNHSEFFVNARTALAQALISASVNDDTSVLIPAYHCGSMVEPALWLNTEVLLYQVNSDLTPHEPHLEQLISTAQKPVRALLLPHYFGFPQQIDHWVSFCQKHQLILIEDCAHAFFGTYQTQPIGSKGEYAIASARKFFGCVDGGILIRKSTNTVNRYQLPNISVQIKSALTLLMRSAGAGGLGRFGKILNKVDQWRTKQPAVIGTSIVSSSTQSWEWFNPDLVTRQGQPLSKWLIQHGCFQTIINARRNNYRHLLDGISSIASLEPLFPNLPDHVVPYMFPALLTSGEADFDRLKRAGIPLWRWEELADSDCSVSQRYRLQLLHIPCHQNMKKVDIDALIKQLTDILGKDEK